MTIQFPRRRWDEAHDCWVPEMPPIDEEEALLNRLESSRHTLEAKFPNGRHAYTEQARKQAAAHIIEINEQLAALGVQS